MAKSKNTIYDAHTSILKKSGALHSDCANCTSCSLSKDANRGLCKQFRFIEDENGSENAFYSKVLPYLIQNNTPSRARKLRRSDRADEDLSWESDDAILPLDSFYVGLINDVLSEIRKGNIGYVFNLEQVREILRFESEAEFTLDDATEERNSRQMFIVQLKKSSERGA